MLGLAWVHLVALGWITLIALSVLLFVVPQFTDVKWRGEGWARLGVGLFAAGAYAMVAAFLVTGVGWLWVAAAIAVAGIAVFIIAAFATLAGAVRARGAEAAIARAFVVVFLFLGVAAGIGVRMARDIATGDASQLATAAPAHASLAAIGWLTLLVMGVSARTIGPITGHRSPRRWAHIVSSTLVTVGALALGLAFWTGSGFERVAFLICVAGLIVYAFDMLWLVMTSTSHHRPPQAFVAAAIVWMLVASALGIASSGGDARFGPALILVGLVGWIGQMVTAHLHHIGVRLIATIARGHRDETPPAALLHAGLSWASFVLFQGAVGVGCVALLMESAPALGYAAILGLVGWLAMTANMARASVTAGFRH